MRVGDYVVVDSGTRDGVVKWTDGRFFTFIDSYTKETVWRDMSSVIYVGTKEASN